jgi:hypothetical protein
MSRLDIRLQGVSICVTMALGQRPHDSSGNMASLLMMPRSNQAPGDLGQEFKLGTRSSLALDQAEPMRNLSF